MLLATGLAVLAGCESTFDRAARARAEAGPVKQASALNVTKIKGVTTKTLAIIPSADGLTAAVVIKVTSTDPAISLVWAPIDVTLLDASGNVIGTNNIVGALPVLVHLSTLHADQEVLYVNDQIMVSGVPAEAQVVIGGKLATAAPPAGLQVSKTAVIKDVDLGIDSWTATVKNTTGVRQEQVIVQAIVRDGTKIVGAGTALVNGLDSGASAAVTGYFVGSATGELQVFAPASNAADGAGAQPENSTAPSESSGTGGMTLQIG